jgi:hypothetical protein
MTGGIQVNRPPIDQGADDIDRPVLCDQLRAAHRTAHRKANPALIPGHDLLRMRPRLSSPATLCTEERRSVTRPCKNCSHATPAFGAGLCNLRTKLL